VFDFEPVEHIERGVACAQSFGHVEFDIGFPLAEHNYFDDNIEMLLGIGPC